MNMNIVYNDIAYVLQRNATTTHNVYVSSSPIQGFVTVKDELLGQLYKHVLREHNPKRLRLTHGVPESPWFRGDSIIVGVISDNVVLAAFASNRVLPEPDGAVCQALPVVGPVRVTFPAVIDRVTG